MSNYAPHRSVLALTVLIAALALMAGFAASGFLLANALQPDISERRADLAHLRQQLARIARHDRPAVEARKQSPNWDQLLLPVMSAGAAGAQLQGRLNAAAARAGAHLIRARVKPQTGDGLLRRVTVNVDIKTKVKALRDLLFALEHDAPLTFVDRIEIARRTTISADDTGKAAGDDPNLAVSVQVSNYMKEQVSVLKQ